jgi:hypothetical protein
MRVHLALAAVIALGCAVAASGAPRPAAALYLVRPDPRMCPSPLCGGWWVRQVNHAVTTCGDASRSRECYVARADGIPETLRGTRAGTLLVRGRVLPATAGGFSRLVVLAAWRPAGESAPAGTTFRVVDNGVRCVTAPCFSLTAAVLETTRSVTLSDLDLDPVGAGPGDLRRARAAVTQGGLIVTGRVRTVADAGPAGAGRVLVATEVWLRP